MPADPPNALVERTYQTLRAIARRYFESAPGHTLQPTALVHEAFLRLAKDGVEGLTDRSHFVALATTAMRHIMVDHARRRQALKRGGGMHHVTLDESACGERHDPVELLALDAAIEALAQLSERQARGVELRFFGGLSAIEIAQVLGCSSATVERDWRHARAWLKTYGQL